MLYIMKRIIFISVLLLMTSFTISAQSNGNTKAIRISNGCGSENSKGSQIGSKIANLIDPLLTGTTIKQQKESCDQHDKDYYNGVNKEKADRDFSKRSPVKGYVVESANKLSQESYNAAQEDRKRSHKLQSSWEKENKACLDSENYRIDYKNK